MKKINPDVLNSGETMTVGELKEALNDYSDDLPVLATWESVFAGFRKNKFRVSTYQGREELVIDVENYG